MTVSSGPEVGTLLIWYQRLTLSHSATSEERKVTLGVGSASHEGFVNPEWVSEWVSAAAQVGREILGERTAKVFCDHTDFKMLADQLSIREQPEGDRLGGNKGKKGEINVNRKIEMLFYFRMCST